MSRQEIQEIVKRLCLVAHDEGGWFRETYRAEVQSPAPAREGGSRSFMTTIYYMLDQTAPHGVLHRNISDIHHFYQGGGLLRYVTLDENGHHEEHLLGPGHQLQLTVAGGVWKASELIEGAYGLVGEAVAPGFDYRDREIASPDEINEKYPQLHAKLSRFLRR